MSNEAELKQLLRDAEAKIAELAADHLNMAQAYHELMQAQKAETQQIVELTEQIWALEEALAGAHGEKGKALEALKAMKKKLEVLRNQAKATLEAAAANASRLELAARVYELAKVTEQQDELDRRIAEFNAGLGR